MYSQSATLYKNTFTVGVPGNWTQGLPERAGMLTESQETNVFLYKVMHRWQSDPMQGIANP